MLLAAIFSALFSLLSANPSGVPADVKPAFTLGGYDAQNQQLPYPSVYPGAEGGPVVRVRFVSPVKDPALCILYEAIRIQGAIGRVALAPLEGNGISFPRADGDPRFSVPAQGIASLAAFLAPNDYLSQSGATRETAGTYTIVVACRAGTFDNPIESPIQFSNFYRAQELETK